MGATTTPTWSVTTECLHVVVVPWAQMPALVRGLRALCEDVDTAWAIGGLYHGAAKALGWDRGLPVDLHPGSGTRAGQMGAWIVAALERAPDPAAAEALRALAAGLALCAERSRAVGEPEEAER